MIIWQYPFSGLLALGSSLLGSLKLPTKRRWPDIQSVASARCNKDSKFTGLGRKETSEKKEGCAPSSFCAFKNQLQPCRLRYSMPKTSCQTKDRMHRDQKAQDTVYKISNEYSCPITKEFPADPVLAEDGKVYERQAIEQYIFETQWFGPLLSPTTNNSMGKTLLPVLEVKHSIEKLVKAGTLSGEKVDRWRRQTIFVDILKKAEEGDIGAMFAIGRSYEKGLNSDGVNLNKAFCWYKRAADQGHITAAAKVGNFLFLGKGTGKDRILGMYYLTSAAKDGSDAAALSLGHIFNAGVKDSKIARVWYKKVADKTCKYKVLPDSVKRKAASIAGKI